MNTHLITAALRDLDPAPETVLTEAERARADATFARVLATPGGDPVPVEPARPRRRRRLLLVPVGLAGGAVIPALLLGGGPAYAGWTPTPEPLAAEAASSAETTCRSRLELPGQGERVLIAERRGGWTYVLISGPEAEGTCLMPDDLVGQDLSDCREGDFFGQGGAKDFEDPTPARDGIDETTSMQGSTDEGWFSLVEGHVGSEVTGVTVHTSSGLDVEASVEGGRFAAWWPGVEQSSDNPGGETWTYTVTLADGSTRRTTG